MLLKSLILSGTVLGLFLILIIRAKNKKSDPDKLLMIWLGIVALQLLFYYDDLSTHPLIPNYIQLIGFSLPLISSPVIYLYIFSLSFSTRFKWGKVWLHLLPFIIFNLVHLYLNYLYPGGVILNKEIPHFSRNIPVTISYFLMLLVFVIPAYYTVLSLITLLKYQKLLPQNYSNTEKITLNWLKGIVISLLILFILLFVLIKYGVSFGLINYDDLFGVVGSILAFYIFFIGYFGLRQNTIFTNTTLPTLPEGSAELKKSYKNSGLNKETILSIYDRLKLHMTANKPYLDEELTLAELATQLNLIPNQLSQVINQQSSSNFFYFINKYRVDAVKEKLKDPAYSHYSILGIGYECGFRSKSSLNKIFKEMEGMTPSQYQKF